MGQSTDAIVCFGIALGDENEIPEWVWELAGVKDTRDDDDAEDDPVESLRDALDARKLELVDHCHGECTMHILAAKGSEMRCSRGDTLPLPIGQMEADKGVYRYRIHEALLTSRSAPDRTDVKCGWLMCSMWD